MIDKVSLISGNFAKITEHLRKNEREVGDWQSKNVQKRAGTRKCVFFSVAEQMGVEKRSNMK